MSYMDKFRKRKKPIGKLDKILYSLGLSYDFHKQFANEFLGKHKSEIDEGFISEEAAAEWLMHMEETVQIKAFRRYFNPIVFNAINIPKKGGGMLTANHSGTLGWDGLAILLQVFKQTGRVPAMIGHNMFGNSDIIKTLGASCGSREDARAILEKDRLALVCPGGAKEATKPFWKRYLVEKVGGFAEGRYGYLWLALETQKPIIPLGVVGVEETHLNFVNLSKIKGPVNKIYDRLPKKAQKRLEALIYAMNTSKASHLPLNVLPFRSKIDIWVGEPLYFHERLQKVDQLLIKEYKEFRKREKNPQEHSYLEDVERKLSGMNDVVISKIEGLIEQGISHREQKSL